MASHAGPLSFPGAIAEWLLRAVLLCLQWRDRAGIAPDFPLKPVVGTIGHFICTTAIQGLLSAAALFDLVKVAAVVPQDLARQAIQRKIRALPTAGPASQARRCETSTSASLETPLELLRTQEESETQRR
jgi:hypothetical protein